MLKPGTILEKYRIEGARGQGGMGIVYEATQLSLDRRLALKVLHQELAQDPAFVERFRREGRVQASLDHPHVVTVYEAGESEQGLFLSMRLVNGTTLAALLREGGLDAGRALRLLAQVASALDAAHAAGLVHRDVKPQNVLVDEADKAYLADFGLTKIGNGAGAVTGSGAMTSTGPMLGTVSYLAPEVIRGEHASAASDRYALAAMLFECLSGTVVYPRSSDIAVLYAHTSEPPPKVTERRGELPSPLDDVLAAGLAKDPAQRPATARSLVEQAVAALGSEAIATLGPPAQAEPMASSGFAVAASPSRAGRTRRSVRLVPVVAGLLVVAVSMFFLGGRLRERALAEKPPPIPVGAQLLGSDLTQPGDSLDCNGQKATAISPSCSIAQVALPGSVTVAPQDGAIFSWGVRGAKGEMRLQIFRERDGAFQVAVSQFVHVSDESIHTFATNLFIKAGDFIGLALGPGASIGMRSVDGATTKRWFPRKSGGDGKVPDRGPGTGVDREVLFRADYTPGAQQRFPTQTIGDEAANAAAGKEVDRRAFVFTDGRAADIAIVELERVVAVDLFRNKVRVARIEVPDLIPGGEIMDVLLDVYDAPAEAEIGITWRNPESGHVFDHYFGIAPVEFIWFV